MRCQGVTVLPGDRDKADSLINDLFTLLETSGFGTVQGVPITNVFPVTGPTTTGPI